MKKKVWLLAGSLLLALVPVALLVAADEAPTKSLTGEVVAVDAAAKTVTVKAGAEPGAEAKEMRLTVDGATKMIKDGKPIDLAQLQKGDRVVANYRSNAGGYVAVTIGVQKTS